MMIYLHTQMQVDPQRVQDLENSLNILNSTNQQLSTELNSTMATISDLMQFFDTNKTFVVSYNKISFPKVIAIILMLTI